MISSTDFPSRRNAALGWWLVAIAGMIFVMVVLGGATRLTESGLSITDWRPVSGVIPPLSDADWQALYQRYRDSPEFRDRNFWMSLGDFRTIYWMEYVHRLWGRLIGLAFLLPFLWFLWRGRISRPLGWRLAGIFALGGVQGLVGWLMVKSGLVDRPDVSHYRLAAHLLLAVAIYGCVVWLALQLLAPDRPQGGPLRRHAFGLLGWLLIAMTYGAFVAGLDAGFIYNTFPLMEGHLVPPDAWALAPGWRNAVENPALVQLIHRVLGIGLVVIVLALWWRARNAAIPLAAQTVIGGLTAMALVQMGLGIATLLSAVPVALGVLHQAGALVLFTLALSTPYALGAAAGRARRPNSSAPAR